MKYLCNLPGGFKHLIVYIDHFPRWSKAKAIFKKNLCQLFASFLYEIICWHGCFKMQINETNQVAESLHKMTGTAQRITSAYHPQSTVYVNTRIVPSKIFSIKCWNNFFNTEKFPLIKLLIPQYHSILS